MIHISHTPKTQITKYVQIMHIFNDFLLLLYILIFRVILYYLHLQLDSFVYKRLYILSSGEIFDRYNK